MASANNRVMTLTTVGNNVTINVTYNAVFTAFERHLCALGLQFRERIAVVGVDADGPSVLANFPSPNFAVTDGNGSQTITRNVSITVPRSELQEDGDDDEISCRIRIEAIGLPLEVTPDRFTTEGLLLG